METFSIIKDIILIVIPIASIFLIIQYRNKDYHITVFKEQIQDYKSLLTDLNNLIVSVNLNYQKHVGGYLAYKGLDSLDEDNLRQMQTLVFVESNNLYTETYQKLLINSTFYENSVSTSAIEFFECLANLIENHTDDYDLGIKLKMDLYDALYKVSEAIRKEMNIDKLNREKRRLIESGFLNLVIPKKPDI